MRLIGIGCYKGLRDLGAMRATGIYQGFVRYAGGWDSFVKVFTGWC